MNLFCMNEGTLTLPFAYEDSSMTMLKFPEQQSSLVITRSHADPKMTLEECAKMQLTLFKREFKTVTLGQQKQTTLGHNFPAIEFFAEFQKGGSVHYQINLLLKHHIHFMALTYTQNRLFDKSDLAIWQTIKLHFSPSSLMQMQFGASHE